MTKSLLGPFVALLIALVVGTPAVSAAASKEQQQMMADIRMLQEQSQQLQILLGALNESLKATNARIDARIDEQTNVTRKAFADQKLSIDNVTNDLRVVREKVDDNNVRVSSLTQELETLRQAVQQRSAPPPTITTEPDALGAGTALAGGATTPAAPPLAVGTSPQRLWDTSQASYVEGSYDLAVQGFEAYIRYFPKSDMADDAQVQIGNSYFNDGKFDKAVGAYDAAVHNYPNGNAVPEAYYKKGIALQRLGERDGAREALEYAAKTFPDSDAGRLARQRLGPL